MNGDPVGGRVLVVVPSESGDDPNGGSFVRGGDASGIDSDGNRSAPDGGTGVPNPGSGDGASAENGESSASDADDRTAGGSDMQPKPSSGGGDNHRQCCGPKAVAAGISDRLSVDVVLRTEQTAAEYLEELGPTIDCVVILGGDIGPLGTPVDDASIPAVVCERPVVERDAPTPPALDQVADRVRTAVDKARTRSNLQDQNMRLTALSRYASDITGCETIDAVLDRTVEAATDALAFDYCVIFLVSGDRLVPRASALPDPDPSPSSVTGGIAGRTLTAGKAEVVSDLQSDPDAIPEHDDLHALVSVPIGSWGVLQIASRSRDAFDERDKEFAEALSGYTREALSRLDREVTLRAERDRLHAFYTAVPVPVLCVGRQDGQPAIIEANDAYNRAFAETPADRPLSAAIRIADERDRYEAALNGGSISRGTVVRRIGDRDEAVPLTVIPFSPPGGSDYAFGVYWTDLDDTEWDRNGND